MGQQQALQRVLAAGTGGAGPVLLPCQPLPCSHHLPSVCWMQLKAHGKPLGSFPPQQPLANNSLQFPVASPTIRNRKSR